MTNLSTCAVIVPVYKKIPDKNEQKSLEQVFKILKEFKFYIVCPDSLDISHYINTANTYQIDIARIGFNPNYFTNIAGYNKLLLSPHFYKKFITFTYILIYQLDAWIFKNELNYWCNQNYDYLGAPWIYEGREGNVIFAGVGNGGFSLRKVRSHIKVLKSFSLINSLGYAFYLFKSESPKYGYIKSFIKNIIYNNSYHRLNTFSDNEDLFWGISAKRNFKWFKVPGEIIASKFSVELMPTFFIRTNNDLPFGCHAWEKYEPDFWKKYIKI